jgi:hypothetical protein
VSQSSYWEWISKSQKGDESFVFEWLGDPIAFHEAIGLARKIALQSVLGKYETRMMQGSEEKIYYQGRPQFKERADCIGVPDDAVRDVMGLQHRWEIDPETNEPIQLTVHHEPPIQGVIKLLESNFKAYRPKTEVSQTHKISGGVTVVNAVPKAALPPVEIVQAAPALPRPEEPAEDIDFLELEPIAATPEEADLHEEHEHDAEAWNRHRARQRHATKPEPAPKAEPEPPKYERKATGTLSPLERDLLERLARRPQNPTPSRPVEIFRPEPEDSDDRRVGAGPAGRGLGVKVK